MTTESLNKSYETREDVRRSFYKNQIKKDNIKLEFDENDSQEKRRNLLLAYQKKHREEALNIARGIFQDSYFSELEDEEPMDVEEKSSSFSKSRYKSRSNRIMLSEWMLNVPQDFLENWIMVPCPVGKRTRLVSGRGKTMAFSRKGLLVGTFPSALPGGNSNTDSDTDWHHCAIVDGIWIKEQKLYYILDVLYWHHLPFTNCEAEFRLYWVNTKICETKEFEERDSDTNKYPILSLPNISCDSSLSPALTDLDSKLHPLDGFLFYHRNAHYIFGVTPLVTWLKPYMLSEVLGISVPSFVEKPDEYVDFQHHIESVNSRKKKRKVVSNFMEIEEI